MLQSLFAEYVTRNFASIVSAILVLINGGKTPLTYKFKEMLNKKYSPTLRWDSLSTDGVSVAADVVAMDSPLPLKKRQSFAKASGDIPKLGTKRYLDERTMTNIDIMRSAGSANENQILALLFADTKNCIVGIWERLEFQFLQALSTGITATTDAINVGPLIRVDYNYLAANKFGAEAVIWSNSSATPIKDISRVVEKARADGNQITRIIMDKYAWNNFKLRAEVQQYYAFHVGFVGTNLIVPTRDKINEALNANDLPSIEVWDRTIKTEIDGVVTNNKPWAEGNVVFICNDKIGDLVWGNTAEKNRPVNSVDYQTVDEYILVSKFSKNDPTLAEFTQSQGIVLPVLGNVDQIYLLESKTVQV